MKFNGNPKAVGLYITVSMFMNLCVRNCHLPLSPIPYDFFDLSWLVPTNRDTPAWSASPLPPLFCYSPDHSLSSVKLCPLLSRIAFILYGMTLSLNRLKYTVFVFWYQWASEVILYSSYCKSQGPGSTKQSSIANGFLRSWRLYLLKYVTNIAVYRMYRYYEGAE